MKDPLKMLKDDNVKRSPRREEGSLVNNGLDMGITKIVRRLSNLEN